MGDTPTISTHVLDTENGTPAAGVAVSLWLVGTTDRSAGSGTTDTDGRIRNLLEGPLTAGEYRIDFEIAGRFFVRLSITFHVDDTTRSYHVPLLLAPYSMASYRGS